MANANGWGDGASNNDIGWGQGADNAIGWGSVYSVSSAGLTDIIGTPAVDPDAQAFITAASITDPTQQSAINQLVVDLKGYGVWTKMNALYPFVGGSSTSHSYNLRNTAQHQITWVGGVTHASTGVTFNGTNGYGNTNLSPSSILTANSNHVSVYSRTSAARTNAFAVDWGQATTTGGENAIFGCARRSSNLALYYASNAAGAGGFTAANTNGSGMFVNSITSATSRKIYRNTTTLGTLTTNVSQTLSTFNVAIGALNANNSPTLYSDYQAAFFSIGDGLTDTEAANFYTAVQTFQTALGRQIGTPIPYTSFPLDTYTNSTIAYSLRRLSSTYTGSLIRVRRSSDNTEMDFSYGLNNELDTASLLTFCGAGNGFVTTWYDQSGNANNSTQATAANQAQVVLNGNLILDVDTNKITTTWTSDSYNLTTGISANTKYLSVSMFRRGSTTTDSLVHLGNSASTNPTPLLWIGAGSSYSVRSYMPTLLSFQNVSTVDRCIITSLKDGSNLKVAYRNGTQLTTTATEAPTATTLNTFGQSSTFFTSGQYQEYIYWNNEQSANRMAIETDINTYWNAY